MNESDQYSSNEMQSLSQSELESRALINTASKLNYIREHWEEGKAGLDEALDKNRKLWTIIASAMKEDDCPQPEEVRQNILNLSIFFSYSRYSLAIRQNSGLSTGASSSSQN